MIRPVVCALVALCLAATFARAHETRPAYLELRQTSPDTYDVLWKVPANGDLRLGLDVILPDTCETLTDPRPTLVGDAFTERWSVREPGAMIGRTIRVQGLEATLTDVLVRVTRLDGMTQVVRLTPASPAFVVEASPSRWQVALTYFQLGVQHILLGVDHLLFVLGLVLLVDRRWMLLKTVTAFTVAHSITLALSTLAVIHVPGPPLNAAIALSILFLGPEIERKRRGGTSLSIRHPWIVAFAFGLLHGVGFASGLSLVGVPHVEVPFALLFFNLGVEAGQVAFVLLCLACAAAAHTLDLARLVTRWRIPAYVVGTAGAFWTIQTLAMLFAKGTA